jgi:hypothetical protein
VKKLLLFISITLLTAVSASAQCTPGANFADSTYGVWCNCTDVVEGPDTVTYFPNGTVGVPYSQDMNFKVPTNVTPEMDAAAAGSLINNFTVTGVTGLPPGLVYGCNTSSCFYLGGVNGCANIIGVPTTVGAYNIAIEVTGNIAVVLIPGFPPVNVDQDIVFDGYRIVIDPAGSAGIAEIITPNFLVYPNPANSTVNLLGMKGFDVQAIKVVNTSGSVVASMENVNSSNVSIDIANLEEGIYFINVETSSNVEVIRFVKK